MKKILVLALTLVVANALANVVGISAHPFNLKRHIIQGEFNGNFSSGSGMGLQGRYMFKKSKTLSFDTGIMLSNSDRSSRIYGGADWEIYPDHAKQPRVSIKAFIEKTDDFDIDTTSMGFAPIVSKGISISGNEAFPFISLPLRISLDPSTKRYQPVYAISTGITGRLPWKSMKHLTGNIEANFNLKNSYTGLLFGVAYPLQ